MLLDMFREGGWGMWPTLVFGSFTIGFAIRAALQPARHRGALWTTAVATAFSGMLGFIVGVIKTFQAIAQLPASERFGISLIGISESAWNIVLALVVGVLVALVLTVGEIGRKHTGFAG